MFGDIVALPNVLLSSQCNCIYLFIYLFIYLLCIFWKDRPTFNLCL